MKTIAATSAIAGALLLGTAAPAHADYISDAGDDSWAATCHVLGEDLTGNVSQDGDTVIGIAMAIGVHYDLSLVEGVQVENYQVQTYCPHYWPNLVAVGNAARTRPA